MTEWIIASSLGFLAGGAFIWFGKLTIQGLVLDANTLSAKLRAKADAVSAAAKKV